MDYEITRPDGRTNGMLREMNCSRGLLHRADGSAQFSAHKTSVLCGVYGPTEVKLRDEELDRATLEVVFKQNIGMAGPRERAIETTVRSTLEPLIKLNLHPRTLIQVTLQTVQGDGSLLAAACNAACIALMDAGVPLHSAFAAVSLAITDSGAILFDPSREEEELAQSTHTFVFDADLEGAYAVHSEGSFTQEQFEKCYENARLSARVIIDYHLKVMKAAPASMQQQQ
ncbi:exosome non-catalytic core subunit rrp46 [Blastocladiella emersonii ATCC 22665]|nr:exosome non-catalytic core subunit rrp46 [Blastocladiella emersonii ATCC 22665]